MTLNLSLEEVKRFFGSVVRAGRCPECWHRNHWHQDPSVRELCAACKKRLEYMMIEGEEARKARQ